MQDVGGWKYPFINEKNTHITGFVHGVTLSVLDQSHDRGGAFFSVALGVTRASDSSVPCGPSFFRAVLTLSISMRKGTAVDSHAAPQKKTPNAFFRRWGTAPLRAKLGVPSLSYHSLDL